MNKPQDKVSMVERRQEPRVTLHRAVEVQHAETGETLGRMLNLSHTGFMLLSHRAFDPGYRIDVMLRLPEHEPVTLQATCTWCQAASFGDTYGAGFQLDDQISQTARALIARLLANPD